MYECVSRKSARSTQAAPFVAHFSFLAHLKGYWMPLVWFWLCVKELCCHITFTCLFCAEVTPSTKNAVFQHFLSIYEKFEQSRYQIISTGQLLGNRKISPPTQFLPLILESKSLHKMRNIFFQLWNDLTPVHSSFHQLPVQSCSSKCSEGKCEKVNAYLHT